MPSHIRIEGRIRVDAPSAIAFHFFTPRGEEIWIDQWRPRYVFPADGVSRAGMVFTTGEDEEFTIWQLLDFDPARCHARYARTTPASRTGTVTINVRPLGSGDCEVQVTYDLTALTEAGEAALNAFADEPFARMMEDWSARIRDRLPRLMAHFAPNPPR